MLTRRELLTSAGATAICVPLVACGAVKSAEATEKTLTTPRQTAGPFYPDEFPADHDANLVEFLGADGPARGDIVNVRGMVTDAAGEPVSGAMVDLWQCDANGIYHHPDDTADGRDEAFQGFGRTETDSDGAYAFQTIRPVPYPGRTPHIHIRVWRDDRSVLTTQFYDADQAEANMADGLFRRMSEAERALVTVAFVEDEEATGTLAARLDVQLA